MAQAKKQTTSKKEKVSTSPPSTITFEYIKSNFFRVAHIDGAYGGIGPGGDTIQMAFFSERQAIPLKEVYQLQDGHLGDRQDRESREGIIREVELEAFMDLDTARALCDWLANKIQRLEQVTSETKA